jgi:hypothetical protein
MSHYLVPQDNLFGSYKYLMDRSLHSIYNMESFVEIIKEIYYEALDRSEVPSAMGIAERIDDENINIIMEYYRATGADLEHIDNTIIPKYVHNISCQMDDWVKDVLSARGMLYKEDSFFSKKIFYEVSEEMVGQNILFEGFMR